MPSKSYQRSKIELEKRGYIAGKVEQAWNQYTKVRQDYCGFADIIAFHPEQNETLAIQACVGSGDVSKHLKKFADIPAVLYWILQSSRRLEIWSWAKRGERGKRKTWTVVVTEVTKDLLSSLNLNKTNAGGSDGTVI